MGRLIKSCLHNSIDRTNEKSSMKWLEKISNKEAFCFWEALVNVD